MHLLHSAFIQNWFHDNFDIIFISETHLTKGQIFEIPDFIARHNAFSTVDDVKARGGVSCFISPMCLHYVKDIAIDIPDHISINFKNGNVIFSSYIPPSDSRYFKASDFSKIASMFVQADEKSVILGGGDMNGRVGNIKYPLPKYMEYLPNVDTIVNDHGKEILRICQAFKVYVLNNLKTKEKRFQSCFTYKKGENESQNDLILGNRAAINSVNSFTVHDIIWNPSDHKPISISFKHRVMQVDHSSAASSDISDDSLYDRISKPKKISTANVNWGHYCELIGKDCESYKLDVDHLNSDKSLQSLDKVVSSVSNSLYNAAKANIISSSVRNPIKVHSGGIFDDIANIFARQKDANCIQGWDELRNESIKHIQREVSTNELSQWSSILQSKDTKDIWNKINWKGTFTSSSQSDKPELQDLATQFSVKGQAGRESTVLCDVTGTNYVPILDDEISLDEISIAQKRLKEDKSSGDGWVKNMITNIPLSILLLLQIIYNTILKFHIFPTSWRTTVISEIFKNKGSMSVAKNYRGISLVHLLAKLFDFILLERFKRWFVPADEQTAYREKRGSANHVFLLRCMSQHAKRFKLKLFMIAIDFDGAFDRVCRSLLIRKLCLFGAGTVFTACLASIYMSTDNIIFCGNAYVTYKLYSGIKQGLPLSPLLFLFYINDVFSYLGLLYDHGKNAMDLLHILIHADDATILARDRATAISKLQSMLEYCDLNKIICQFSKCEFLVVNGESGDSEPLPFGKDKLKNVDHILLLGSHLSSAASVKEELKLHMCKRFRSVIKFYNFLRSNVVAPLKVKLKVLKSCVLTSLLYNCETWGNTIPEDLESTYLKLLKSCLNVRLSTPNAITYIESGFLPIKAVILTRQFKFYTRFKESIQKNSRREKMFKLLLENQTSFIRHYEQLLSKYSSVEDIINEFRNQTKDKIHEQARKGRTKFSTYLEMNPTLNSSPLLDVIHPVVNDMTRFRLGSHFLPIETGRWTRLNRDERLCNTCGEIGDEKHILFSCSRIDRSDTNLSDRIDQIWTEPDLYKIFRQIRKHQLV